MTRQLTKQLECLLRVTYVLLNVRLLTASLFSPSALALMQTSSLLYYFSLFLYLLPYDIWFFSFMVFGINCFLIISEAKNIVRSFVSGSGAG